VQQADKGATGLAVIGIVVGLVVIGVVAMQDFTLGP
jgi:hypothetical protein